MGGGPNIGGFGASLTANWMFRCREPKPKDLEGLLTGPSFSGGGGGLLGFLGGSLMWSPGNGMAGGFGFASPGGSGSFTVSKKIR